MVYICCVTLDLKYLLIEENEQVLHRDRLHFPSVKHATELFPISFPISPGHDIKLLGVEELLQPWLASI